jgi:OOP family OmpA-OmpF porin
MIRLILILMTVLFTASVPVLATAEIREGSFELSPFIGYALPGHDYDDRPVYGMRAGYNFTKNWGLEGAYEYINHMGELYHADVVYHFTPEKAFNPFLFAGAGVAHIKKESNTEFMGNFGLGFKYSITDTVAFRTDIRDVLTDFHSVVATAGLTFTFGGKTPKAAPAPMPEPKKPEPMPEPKPAPKPEPIPEVKPAPKPEPQPVVVAPEPIKIVLEDIHFDFDKATLTKAAVDILRKDAKTLKDNPGVRVQIEGHACAHGSEAHNMALSERRANAVKEYLIKDGGLSADRLTTISYGETRLAMPEVPTAKNKNSTEAMANRRVHFEVIVK